MGWTDCVLLEKNELTAGSTACCGELFQFQHIMGRREHAKALFVRNRGLAEKSIIR
jgi:hypothetical protein